MKKQIIIVSYNAGLLPKKQVKLIKDQFDEFNLI